jgi:hypothetical protein
MFPSTKDSSVVAERHIICLGHNEQGVLVDQALFCPWRMGVSSLMNDIELACLLLPRGKG